jgi:hypothetical protein
VAVKLLTHQAVSGQGQERLLRAARVTAQFNHSTIESVFDAGQPAGLGHIVMKLVEGRSPYAARRPSVLDAIGGAPMERRRFAVRVAPPRLEAGYQMGVSVPCASRQ